MPDWEELLRHQQEIEDEEDAARFPKYHPDAEEESKPKSQKLYLDPMRTASKILRKAKQWEKPDRQKAFRKDTRRFYPKRQHLKGASTATTLPPAPAPCVESVPVTTTGASTGNSSTSEVRFIMRKVVDVDVTPTREELSDALKDASEILRFWLVDRKATSSQVDELTKENTSLKHLIVEYQVAQSKLLEEVHQLRKDVEQLQENLANQSKPVLEEPPPDVIEPPSKPLSVPLEIEKENWVPHSGDACKIRPDNNHYHSWTMGRVAKFKPNSRKVLVLPAGHRRHEWFDLDSIYPDKAQMVQNQERSSNG